MRRLELAPSDVVYVKGLVEASEGLAALFADPVPLRADGSGPAASMEVRLATTPGRLVELDRFLTDVAQELTAEVLE